MDRQAKVISMVQCIEAARGKAEDPDQYREDHGRCPDGYEYDPLEDKCLPKEGVEPDRDDEDPNETAPSDTDDDQQGGEDPGTFEPADTPEGRREQRQVRREKLKKLFDKDFDAYQKEVARMRETGELPDRETSEMLSQIDKPESLPEEVLNDKDKLREVIEQQAAQREHEQLVLEKTEQALKDFQKKRKKALDAGKRPPKLNVLKLMNDMEEQYGRKLPERTAKIEKMLEDEADDFAAMVSDAETNPGEPSYWWKKWFERMTKPLPTWKPGRRKTSASVLTSPGVTDMKPREIGFPPYDRERPIPKHVPNEPSGRLAFPPYGKVETVEYKERDARMQGFPPYDGKGEPHDTETIGLPPYNKKKPHEGRGFPPYRDGKSVYRHRREAVDEAVR